MTRKVLGYARMGARNKIKGLVNLSLADIKKIYRDEYKRVLAELRIWNKLKMESWKAWNERKSHPPKHKSKTGDSSEDEQVSK